MAYAEQNISVNGTEKDFFDELETFLTKNTVAQFTKTAAYDTTNRSISFAINGLTLKFTGLGNNINSSTAVRIEVNSGRTGAVINTVVFASGGVGNPSYVITDNEYHNIWCIFKLPEETEITGIAVEIAPYAKAKISAFEAFYSSDRAGGNIGNLFEVINTVYDVDNTTQASQVFDVTEDT